MKSIYLFNSLTRKKDEFKPVQQGKLSMYVCGPTVYNYDHLGHARTYVFFDVLKRLFTAIGYEVKYAQNITDIGHLVTDSDEGEDKLEKQAKQENISSLEIASKYEQAHWQDMANLGNQKPDFTPKASDYIDKIIAHIQILLDKGLAYTTTGKDVYFAVEKFSNYGKLSNRKLEDMLQEVRVKHSQDKHSPADFCLWKASKGVEQRVFDSPWGKGVPGWHIECSVMSRDLLGQPFDIHGSAVEHVFPHHENEIAQSEGAYGVELANYWVHTGMLYLNGKKMSKSTGNVILVKDILQEIPHQVIRLALLGTHYRKPLDYKPEIIPQWTSLWQSIIRRSLENSQGKEGYFDKFLTILSDDLNTPQALNYLQEILPQASITEINKMLAVLGIEQNKPNPDPKITKLMSERDQARAQKDWARADQLRAQIESFGYKIEDKNSQTIIL